MAAKSHECIFRSFTEQSRTRDRENVEPYLLVFPVYVRFTAVGRTLNLSLTDELRAFVDRNSGDGTLYATPSEFVRDVLREKKELLEAAQIRDAILEATTTQGSRLESPRFVGHL